MAKKQARKCTKPVRQLATIDQLLAVGMKQGSAKRKDAIKKILNFAGYEPVRKIAQRLSRSERGGNPFTKKHLAA